MTITIENKILRLLISGIEIWKAKTRRGQFGFPASLPSDSATPPETVTFIITEDDKFVITESSNFIIAE